MKYKRGSLTIEAIDTYVRVTIENFSGGNKSLVRCTDKPFPSSADVADLVVKMRGYYPDLSILQACGRASADAKSHEITINL